MSIEDVEKRVDKFDGNDFSLWRSQIEDYLNMKKLAKTLEGKLPKDMKEEEFVEMDRMALGAVRLSLSNDVRRFVIKETTLKGMMDSLSNMYEKPNAVQQLYLMRRLFTLKMGKGISVRQQVGIVGDIIEQLASVDVKFDEHIKALVLLTSMPSDWDVTVNSICSGAGTTKKLKFNDVRDILLNEETRRQNNLEDPSSSALSIENRGRTFNKNSNNNRGRSKSRVPGKGRSVSKSGKWSDGCWHCGKSGHVKRDCNQWKETMKMANTTECDSDALVLSVTEAPLESWIVDSGASFHSTSQQELMVNYRRGNFGKVFLADGGALEIVGRGDVKILLTNGGTWTLTNVRHIP
jgi:hypothetical protein